MSNTLSKILNVLLITLLLIGVAFAFFFYLGGTVEGTKDTLMEEPVATEMFINLGFFYAIIAVFITIGFAVLAIVVNPKAALSTLFGIVVIGVIVLIGYGLASDAIFEIPGADDPLTSAVSKNVGTGLIATYILFAIAVVSILFTEVAARFK